MNDFEIVDQAGQVLWRVDLGESNATAVQVQETVPVEMPDFQDESEALLLNTIERWCIINGFTIRRALVLEKGEKIYNGYSINGERVFICFKWLVDAKVYRRRSKRTRIENFTVQAENRQDAMEIACRKFKGAIVKEFLSVTPVDWGLCFWRDRKNHPNIDNEILERLQMPENL